MEVILSHKKPKSTKTTKYLIFIEKSNTIENFWDPPNPEFGEECNCREIS